MKKQILSIAILAALPFGAWADNPVVSVGPAAVPSNGTAVVATANPPYQTLTPTNDDKLHIASTAYVKGAFNDSIAAVNKVNNTKQAKLVNGQNNHDISANVVSGTQLNTTLIRGLPYMSDSDFNTDLLPQVAQELGTNPDDTLISTGKVLKIVQAVGRNLEGAKQDKLYNISGNGVGFENVVSGSDYHGYGTNIANLTEDDEFEAFLDDISSDVGADLDDALVSAGTTMYWIRGASAELQTDIDTVDNKIDNKRVEIYTTWDNDNAKKQIAFVNAAAQGQ